MKSIVYYRGFLQEDRGIHESGFYEVLVDRQTKTMRVTRALGESLKTQARRKEIAATADYWFGENEEKRAKLVQRRLLHATSENGVGVFEYLAQVADDHPGGPVVQGVSKL